MAVKKITISVPAELADEIKEEVTSGRADSVSGLVCEAVEERLREDRLDVVLETLRRELGAPTREDKEWVRSVLGRSSSTRAR